MNDGEALPAAASREVREETGLEIEVQRVLGRVDIPHGDVVYDVTDFAAAVEGTAELTAGDDACEARWVTRQDLMVLDCSPGLVKTLDQWQVWD